MRSVITLYEDSINKKITNKRYNYNKCPKENNGLKK